MSRWISFISLDDTKATEHRFVAVSIASIDGVCEGSLMVRNDRTMYRLTQFESDGFYAPFT